MEIPINKKVIIFIIVCVVASITLSNCQNEFYQTLTVENGEGGTIKLPIENPKKVITGETETIEATSLGYYEFSHWSNENNSSATFENATAANTKIRIYANTEIKANFVLKTSSVLITSNVVGARAIVDDIMAGNTPYTIILNYGAHNIKVKCDGFAEHNENIIVNSPEMRIDTTLEKL